MSHVEYMVRVGPIRDCFLYLTAHHEITCADVAYRMGWLTPSGHADVTRVKRALGIVPDTNTHAFRVEVKEATAKHLADAMHILPTEVGF